MPAAFTSASLRAISSNVPPTCTVADCLQLSASHGTGSRRAQSTLQTPGP